MDIQNSSKSIINLLSGSLFLLIVITFLIYQQGKTGAFLFDDIPNLAPLGSYDSLGLWDNFWLFLLEGRSGPTGRPISLASFYLNTQNWPAHPASFIQTNIFIHLLNGVLVYWLVFKLSGYLHFPAYKKQLIFSLFVTAFWLLHPMHITTVLYIIQRMTELSATFTLSGLLFYLYGREQLKDTRSGFLTLFIGVGLSLVFSILSKENGILLVAYILVIEFFLLRPLKSPIPKNFNYWLIPAVILPFMAIIVYLGLRTDHSAFLTRDFSLTERLLTEPRIIFDYLHQIFIPRMNELTLYHDDYKISKSLFEPWTTLISLIGVLALLMSAFLLRNKQPLIAFAIAWFFAGHLLESTVLPLELYFEHRNYLPMMGIFIAIVYYAIHFFTKYKVLVVIALGFMLVFNSFVLIQNTKLWGNPTALFISWYQAHPNSIRTQQQFIYTSKLLKPSSKIVQDFKREQRKNHASGMLLTSLVMENLVSECASKTINNDLKKALHILEDNIIHPGSTTNIILLVDKWLNDDCTYLKREELMSFLTSLSTLQQVTKVGPFSHNVHYGLSQLYAKSKNLDRTIFHLEKAFYYNPSVNNLLAQAVYLASAGLYKKALLTLDNTTAIANKGFRAKIALKIRQKEIGKLKEIIRKLQNK